MMRAFRSGVLAMAFVVVAVTCGTASAHSSLTKPQYIARGDAICGAAAAQVAKLGTLNRPLLAKYGYKWLAIDRNALSALRGLAPPAADRATAARLLGLADAAINKSVAGVVSAAEVGHERAVRRGREAGERVDQHGSRGRPRLRVQSLRDLVIQRTTIAAEVPSQ